MALSAATRAAFLANPADPRHGIPTGYQYGCRQDCCRAAHAAKDAARRRGEQTPLPEYRDQLRSRTTARIEDVEFLVSVGETHPENVARRVGMASPVALECFLTRNERRDLWRRMDVPEDAEGGEPSELDLRAALRVVR